MNPSQNSTQGGKLSPQERRYKRDHILSRTGQLLEREFKKNIATPIEVANLAIELARLNGESTAAKYADEAVNLLRKSCEALAKPSPGVRTPKQQYDALVESIEKKMEADRVAYAQLVKLPGEKDAPEPLTAQMSDGKMETFKPYSGEKGFVDLLRRYAKESVSKHVAKLSLLLSSEPARTAEAIQFVADNSYGEITRDVEAIQRVIVEEGDFTRFARDWAFNAQRRFVKRLLADAKAGLMTGSQASHLLRFKYESVQARNKNAADKRKRKSGQEE